MIILSANFLKLQQKIFHNLVFFKPTRKNASSEVVLPSRATGRASTCIFDGCFHLSCSHASHSTSTTP